jgi:SAM-dependent methyltransferase
VAIAGDLWGEACLDYWRTGDAEYQIRRDDGYVDTDPLRTYFRQEPWQSELKALAYVKGRVLDVGCGPGRHLLWLQERGFEVTGIDISAGVVQVARERGGEDVRLCSLFELTTLREKFDTVLLMGNNMGLAGSLEATHALLDDLREVTGTGAVLIGHSANPLATENPAHLAYHQANREAGRYVGQLRIRLEYKGRVSSWFGLVLFEPEVLTDLLAQRGWGRAELIESNWGYFIVAHKV